MNENKLRKYAGLTEAASETMNSRFGEQRSPKEKIKYFERMIQDVWGVKTKVTTDFEDVKKGKGRYKVTTFSPKRVELGYTTLDVGGSFGDSLFGAANGMFLTQEGGKLMDRIRKNYRDEFKKSGA